MRQVLKDQTKKLNLLVSEVIESVNILIQLKKDMLETARKMGEMVHEQWELIKEEPINRKK